MLGCNYVSLDQYAYIVLNNLFLVRLSLIGHRIRVSATSISYAYIRRTPMFFQYLKKRCQTPKLGDRFR